MSDFINEKTGWFARWRKRLAAGSRPMEPVQVEKADAADENTPRPAIRLGSAGPYVYDRIEPIFFPQHTEASTPSPDPQAHALRVTHALARVFEQTHEDDTKAADNAHIKTLSSLFPIVDDDPDYREVVLRNDTSVLTIVPTRVSYLPIAGQDGHADIKKSFTAESAYAMALVASKNKTMLEKGVRLSGSKEQQDMLRAAVERVNAELPEGQKLRIRPPKAVPQAAQAVTGVQAETPKAPVSQQAAQTAVVPTPTATPPQPVPVTKGVDPVAPAYVGERAPFRQIDAKVEKVGEPVDKTRRGFLGIFKARNSVEPARPSNDDGEGISTARRRLVLGGVAAIAAGGYLAGTGKANTTLFGNAAKGYGPAYEPASQVLGRLTGAQDRASPAEEQIAQDAPPTRDVKQGGEQERTALAQTDKQNAARQQAAVSDEKLSRGQVRIVNTHTGERMVMDFAHINRHLCAKGDFSKCHGEFNYVSRDWRRNEVRDMDPELMKVIAGVVTKLRDRGYDAEQVTLLSGYRAPETNRNTPRAGRRSYHIHGKALDFRVEGVPARVLNDVCCEVVGQKGGVGRYGSYAHVDTRGFGVRWHG